MKNILLLLSFTTCISLAYSQAVIQGYSVMYGGARANSDKNISSFNGFNLDYFGKISLSKNFYFKSNVGLARYSSKSPVGAASADVFDYETGENYWLDSDFKRRASSLAISLGTGLDYKIKNFTIGLNIQLNPALRFGNDDDIYMLTDNWISELDQETYQFQGASYKKYFIYGYSWGSGILNSLFLTSYSFDMEYTLKRIGFKYSYLLASDRPIHQFGVTYNLKYDWKEVAQ